MERDLTITQETMLLTKFKTGTFSRRLRFKTIKILTEKGYLSTAEGGKGKEVIITDKGKQYCIEHKLEIVDWNNKTRGLHK